ncbi:MAG: hypothetical protein Q9171_001784 [Xanthocarpia ochracea]
MPKAAHEVVKALAALIETEINDANWKHNCQPVPISKTGEAERALVKRDRIWKQQPDESYAIQGSDYPFLVVEAVDSQRPADLQRKLHGWAHGTKARCKIMVVFEVEETTDDYRILMSVIKNKKVLIPRDDHPHGFRISLDYVHDRVEISAPNCAGSLSISAEEVCPEEWELDAVTKARVVDIPLNQFRASARVAIIEKRAQVARDARGPGPYNPDQEDVSTPSSSFSNSLAHDMMVFESGSEQDDPEDLDYTEDDDNPEDLDHMDD